ncbi:MAG: 50S ribosomal protein L28 [Alphaproteobacteria bacterium]
MSKQCDITGKKLMSGHNVSHSMRHTKRRFNPNLHQKTLHSALLGHGVSLRLCSTALRTIDKYNGLDGFMLGWKPRKTETFSRTALRIRKAILARAEATKATA